MDAKRYVEQIKKIDVLIENKVLCIQEMQMKMTSPGGTRLDGMKVKQTMNSSNLEEKIIDCTEKEKELQLQIAALMKKKEDIISVLEELPVNYYDFLYKRYVRGFDLSEIAEMNDRKSYSWATTTSRRALDKLQKILDEKEE